MNQTEDTHKFSKQAVECLAAMGDHVFGHPIESVPWGGRPHTLGRRYILQKYLTNEDILQAFWVQEQAKRTDPRWRDNEPGLSHLSKLLRERSGGKWMQEQDAYQKTTPSLMDYMKAEWGEDTRRAIAQHREDEAQRRRAAFAVVPVS